MNSSSIKKASNSPKLRSYNKIVGIIGFMALLITVFTLQTNLTSATDKLPIAGKTLTEDGKEIPMFQIDREFLSANRARMIESRKAAANRIEPSPTAIPAGTKSNRISFIADDLNNDILALADTNNDLVPDANETFLTSMDKANDIVTSFTTGKKSRKFYAGIVSAGGGSKTQGKVLIMDNDATGTFKGTVSSSFPVGPGTPCAMATIDTPKGDLLVVARHFFQAEYLDGTANDRVSVLFFPPGPNGVPDGTQMGSLTFQTANTTFGGMTADARGNVYISVGTLRNNALGGSIVGIRDTNGDFIPDQAVTFIANEQGDANPVTASSIVARPTADGKGTQLVVYGINEIFGPPNRSQIVTYTDADGDLRADGAAKVFFTAPLTFRGAIGDFGTGTSAFESTHMDFGDDQAFFTYLTQEGNRFTNSGLAFAKDNGNGVSSGATSIMEAPKDGTNIFLFTIISGVPNNTAPSDNAPPTIKVNSPNGGETVNGGTQLAISFTSSDDTGVMSHSIDLSTDGGTTFSVPVASGLGGTAQSFNFPVPPSLDTQMARIRVTARDAAGNMASDSSDANFTVVRGTSGDTALPTVTISSPRSGDSLNGNSMAAITFAATDNVGVMAINIAFAADGTNFSTTLVNGLPGSATTFMFRVPAISSTTAAIRVEAVDAAGNRGNAVVNQLRVVTDTTAPTVTITSPSANTKKINGNSQFNVTFTSTDNIAVASHDVQIALDGTNFTTLASGLPGTATSAMVTIPNMKTKKVAVIRVIARDASGNMGSGTSPAFKIKPSK